MFTGLIEEVGRIRRTARRGGALRLEIEASFGEGLAIGESVAVSGVCLTVHEKGPGFFRADVVRETVERTYLGRLREGAPVNLERALRAGDRLGGHIVQGHVDGVGTIVSLRDEGEGKRMTIRHPDGLARYFVSKGSVALDGASLTIAAAKNGLLEVALVPFTLERTVFGRKRRGDPVHVEADVIGKYVERMARPESRARKRLWENGDA
ncbi:MAG: riboflavin synthase [Candidatus Eisenbacteria bacterium]|nr:riboflavin synthase [Candidatus Eisenbacteria bacterium]